MLIFLNSCLNTGPLEHFGTGFVMNYAFRNISEVDLWWIMHFGTFRNGMYDELCISGFFGSGFVMKFAFRNFSEGVLWWIMHFGTFRKWFCDELCISEHFGSGFVVKYAFRNFSEGFIYFGMYSRWNKHFRKISDFGKLSDFGVFRTGIEGLIVTYGPVYLFTREHVPQ